jgi:acetylornithine/succinyldiaminopimelate/putrescine aminotransferase
MYAHPPPFTHTLPSPCAGNHASTFGGNPLACAAANAVLQAIDDENLLINVNARSEQLRAKLAGVAARLGCVKEVRAAT